MVERTAESLRMEAEGIPLSFEIEMSHQPVFVDCDAPKIERVLTNVINNAMKFTPPGGMISIQVEPSEKDGTEGVFAKIRDTGIGIPPEFVSRVTERFFRVGEQVGGTGLGLAISCEVAERHQGKLEVQSPPPGKTKGTEVRLWLPLSAPPDILLVSCAQGLCSSLERVLSDKGFKVSCVKKGNQALQMLHDGVHQIVVIDDSCNIDALELIMNIKADTTMSDMKVFFITEKPLDHVRSSILNDFEVDTIVKQPDLLNLIEAIEDVGLNNRNGSLKDEDYNRKDIHTDA